MLSWMTAPTAMGVTEPTIPEAKVLLTPSRVPAKLGLRSTWLEKWPEAMEPLKNMPTQSRTITGMTSQPT